MVQDVTAPGRALYAQFVLLGIMEGKTAAEIIAAVGRPDSVCLNDKGETLMQWEETGAYIALLFEASGRFIKTAHTYAAYPSFSEVRKLASDIRNMILDSEEVVATFSDELPLKQPLMEQLQRHATCVCNVDRLISK